MRIAVTGASGFVGSALAEYIRTKNVELVELSRDDIAQPDDSLGAADAVIHCAGLAHRSGKDTPSSAEYDEVNYRLTVNLAQAAKAASVRRFVFVSSINTVAGNSHTALTPDSPYAPISDYGQSKAKAEKALLALDGIEVVIARPPLVCGPGAPGNMRLLMKLCDNDIPLPFGATNNARTLIGSSNLASALFHLATAPAADVAGKIFHPADDAISTKELVEESRRAMGRPLRNIAVPPALLRAALSMVGKAKMAEQLYGDLVVDSTSLRNIGWVPEQSRLDEIAPMAKAFRQAAIR